jgi:TolA-binding protein
VNTHSIRRAPVCGAALAGLVLAVGACAAVADDTDVSTLRQELEAVRQQVDTLQEKLQTTEEKLQTTEQKLQTIEQQQRTQAQSAPQQASGAVPAPAAAAQSPVSVTEGWRKVKPGMMQDEVAQLLGEPAAKFRVGGQLAWYYKYPGRGVGSVLFYDDGRAASSQPPPTHAWW